MTEVLRKMLVAGAAVAALSVAACGQPAAENTADTNTEVAAEPMTNDVAAAVNDAAAATNEAAAATNDAAAAANDAAATAAE